MLGVQHQTKESIGWGALLLGAGGLFIGIVAKKPALVVAGLGVGLVGLMMKPATTA